MTLLLAGAAAAQTAVPAVVGPAEVGGEQRPLVLDADAPVPVWVNGLQVQLALSTGTVDHVTLNDSAVASIGLSAAPADNTADLIIGGRVVLTGRHGKGWLAQGDRLVRREYYWFPAQERLPLAGTIGPFALPHWQVRVEWPLGAAAGAITGPAATALDLPLIGGIDNAAYGVARLGRQVVAVGLDVRMRRALPLVTAATGADLAAELGGRLVGEAWSEEIMMGVKRPVRRLQLDRPLMIGPMRIDVVAVRQGGPRDSTASLEKGQITPLDAEEDPEIMTVRGRILKQRRAARYIMLTRTQLEAAGCSALTVDKARLRWQLACAPLAAPAPTSTPTPTPTPAVVLLMIRRPPSSTPYLSPAALIDPVMPAAPLAELAAGGVLGVVVDGQPRRLHLGDGGAGGVVLNVEPLLPVPATDLQRFRDQVAERTRRTAAALGGDGSAPLDLVRGLNPEFVTTMGRPPDPAPVSLDLAGRQVRMMADWRLPARRLPQDGVVALAALPLPRLRLMWGTAGAATGATAGAATGATAGADLMLAIADRSHDQGVMGVAAVPGIDRLFVGVALASPHDRPVVSMALGRDLERLHGGRWAGPTLRWRDGSDRLRMARQMDLAQPLVLGPLRFVTVLVEQAPGLANYLARLGWPLARPWPDWPRIAGLERELRLPVAVLQAAGCHELVVDKPARTWRLGCGPVSALPAP